MPRPLTPKSFENEDPNRPRSTTPRAYSPSPSSERPAPQGILRRGSLSNNTRALPRSDSPVYPVFMGSRKKVESSHSRSHSPNVSIDRNRPLSPLSSPNRPELYSPKLPVIPSLYNEERNDRYPFGSHLRDDSTSSAHEYPGFHHERSYSNAHSITVPALPDSPLLNSVHPSIPNSSTYDSSGRITNGSLDLGSSIMASQSIGSVLSSPGHSRFRSNDLARGPSNLIPHPPPQPEAASGFKGGPLVLPSLQNSSQISLISTGSSYHSVHDAARQASDAAFSLISQPTTPATSDTRDEQTDWESESFTRKAEQALQLFGLTEENLANMQEKLVQVASPELVLTPQTLSLRRRKNSIPSRVSFFLFICS
jgi:hypothetical protein